MFQNFVYLNQNCSFGGVSLSLLVGQISAFFSGERVARIEILELFIDPHIDSHKVKGLEQSAKHIDINKSS